MTSPQAHQVLPLHPTVDFRPPAFLLFRQQKPGSASGHCTSLSFNVMAFKHGRRPQPESVVCYECQVGTVTVPAHNEVFDRKRMKRDDKEREEYSRSRSSFRYRCIARWGSTPLVKCDNQNIETYFNLHLIELFKTVKFPAF